MEVQYKTYKLDTEFAITDLVNVSYYTLSKDVLSFPLQAVTDFPSESLFSRYRFFALVARLVLIPLKSLIRLCAKSI